MLQILRLLVPAAALAVALTACGGGTSAAPTAPAAPAGNTAAAQEQVGKAKEEPLTGETKQKAEQAALAKYPGTVVKSEHDAEKPGMLAVEIKQANGEHVEVYLDRNFAVAGTKAEGKEDGQDDGDDK